MLSRFCLDPIPKKAPNVHSQLRLPISASFVNWIYDGLLTGRFEPSGELALYFLSVVALYFYDLTPYSRNSGLSNPSTSDVWNMALIEVEHRLIASCFHQPWPV
ncbi:hypothetical protein PGTUg99_036074 [Puccinia graminis f. sp. tritici]|uniref:Uncharacterized protein n=1 Tax=Puccinia graminis f. sp. tritici TaxID=56615 RepID=A0A5B0NNN6_PUCGR|nr:hypothetical protein PGTUg99_036074 [Puccinia graminis f. sp. tritici]